MDWVKDVEAATWIALGALVVSIYSLWRGFRSSGRANLTLEWETGDSVLVTNHGPGEARNVVVTASPNMLKDDWSFPYMGQFQTVRVYAPRGFNQPMPKMSLAWSDNRLRPQYAEIDPGQPPIASSPRANPSSNLEKVVRDLARAEAQREIADQVKGARRRY